MTRLIVAYLRLPLVTHQNQRIFLFMSSRQTACGRFQFPWAHHIVSLSISLGLLTYLNSTLNYITTPSRLECIYLSNTTMSCVRQVHTLQSSLIINTTGMTNLMTKPFFYTHIPIHCSLSNKITHCTI